MPARRWTAELEHPAAKAYINKQGGDSIWSKSRRRSPANGAQRPGDKSYLARNTRREVTIRILVEKTSSWPQYMYTYESILYRTCTLNLDRANV
jgi:hypothetical protein